MKIEFTENGWLDFSYWIDNDQKTAQKIKELLRSIQQTPFEGIGKPEPLKHQLKGFWSRKISGEHRLVYKIHGTKGIDQCCSIIQCRFHYDDK